MTKKSKSELASQKFEEGFNCAQSSFYSFAINAGIAEKEALKLTTAFGVGMIYRGEMCGAITGAMMALGLKYGRDKAEDADAKELTYFLVKELHDRFEKKFGSILCKELLGLNNTNPESWEIANKNDQFKKRCPMFVTEAVEITEKLIQKLEK